MALVKCRECGHKISKKAKSCPECGHPAQKKRASGKDAFLLLVAAAVAVCVAQDSGVGDEKAYHVIAERHGVGVDAVRKIVGEGIIKGWPAPE